MVARGFYFPAESMYSTAPAVKSKNKIPQFIDISNYFYKKQSYRVIEIQIHLYIIFTGKN